MVTVSDDVRERILSYVKHQVAKGPDGIRDAIQKGHEQLLGSIDGLSEEQATFKSAPDDWNVLEVLRHVQESKRSIARRCVALAGGETPAAIGAIGTIAQEPFSSLADARSALDSGHQELLAFVGTVSSETDVEATYPHPWFGPLNGLEWAAFQRVHDGDHASQIDQIRAAPAFPAA